MKIKEMMLSTALGLMVSLGASLPVQAQGVPVIDGTNLAQNIEQVQQALRDFEAQMTQITTLQSQLETQISSLLNLENILGSITGVNEIAGLFNSIEDIRSRAAKITDMEGFISSLSIGDFDSLLDNLLDGKVTMGEKNAAYQMEQTLAGAGFDKGTLEAMSASEDPQDGLVAQQAATNAAVMGMSQIAYEESGESIERLDGLVDAIGSQDTLKESMDLNSRITAEMAYMLGQTYRAMAAQGLADGQNGILLAAEQAKTRKFFNFNGDE